MRGGQAWLPGLRQYSAAGAGTRLLSCVQEEIELEKCLTEQLPEVTGFGTTVSGCIATLHRQHGRDKSVCLYGYLLFSRCVCVSLFVVVEWLLSWIHTMQWRWCPKNWERKERCVFVCTCAHCIWTVSFYQPLFIPAFTVTITNSSVSSHPSHPISFMVCICVGLKTAGGLFIWCPWTICWARKWMG